MAKSGERVFRIRGQKWKMVTIKTKVARLVRPSAVYSSSFYFSFCCRRITAAIEELRDLSQKKGMKLALKQIETTTLFLPANNASTYLDTLLWFKKYSTKNCLFLYMYIFCFSPENHLYIFHVSSDFAHSFFVLFFH